MTPPLPDPPIVDHPTQITPEWLTTALASAGVNAQVDIVNYLPVGTGQMGSCYRLTISYEAGDGPAQLVVKLPSTNPSSRSAAAAGYRTEVHFYQQLAPDLGIHTPRCWYADVSPDGHDFTLLMDDLAPSQQGDQVAGCTIDQARHAAVNAARLHGPTWNRPDLHRLNWLIPSIADTAEMTAPFLAEATKTFVARYQLVPADAAVLEAFAERFVDWAIGRRTPFSLVHNDYRLDNLLFSPGGGDQPVATVDWQVLTVGLPQRDLAFLLSTGLDPDLRRRHEKEIVSGYHDALRLHDIGDYTQAQCWNDYVYAQFQSPLITVLGAYVAHPTERGDRMFRVMAERSCAAIRDLDALTMI
jgi:hypothetical protein